MTSNSTKTNNKDDKPVQKKSKALRIILRTIGNLACLFVCALACVALSVVIDKVIPTQGVHITFAILVVVLCFALAIKEERK